jgi:hypothetical protein
MLPNKSNLTGLLAFPYRTAARMESNSSKGRVQLSEQTAELLFKANKHHWLIKREDKVAAKGKGSLQTYWLDITATCGSVVGSTCNQEEDNPGASQDEESLDGNSLFEQAEKSQRLSNRHVRLIDWNAECLLRLLKQIVVRREANRSIRGPSKTHAIRSRYTTRGMVLDEVTECIELPEFHPELERSPAMTSAGAFQLNQEVEQQLRDYITAVCCLYKSSNHFHNFEHASHVTMYVDGLYSNKQIIVLSTRQLLTDRILHFCRSVLKLISRVVSPLEVNKYKNGSERRLMASKLHDHTFGLTSDPLILFACAFSALVHDVDHPGVSNSVLIKEGDPLATRYKNKSIAEQNSVDLSWSLLMEDKYAALRAVIFETQTEQDHFRQIVVNCVMATDIFDPDLKAEREQRWNRAFSEFPAMNLLARETDNRKATIVIEHLIQASNIAHTMQHVSQLKLPSPRVHVDCCS